MARSIPEPRRHTTGFRQKNANGPGGPPLSHMGGPENFASITDGLSNTLMVGEWTTRTTTRRGTFWGYTYASYNQSSVTSESRILNNDFNRCANTVARAATTRVGSFGSYHTNGLNFVMCDGSVASFVTQLTSIFWPTWRRLATGRRQRQITPKRSPQMRQVFASRSAVVVLLLTAGCGGTNIVPVSGTVYLDGQPCPNVIVSFQPLATDKDLNPGRGSSAITDASGHFVLIYDGERPGALVRQTPDSDFSQCGCRTRELTTVYPTRTSARPIRLVVFHRNGTT